MKKLSLLLMMALFCPLALAQLPVPVLFEPSTAASGSSTFTYGTNTYYAPITPGVIESRSDSPGSPAWHFVTTSCSIATGVMTCLPQFSVPGWVTVGTQMTGSDFPAGSFLNGTVITIASISGSQFTANVAGHDGYSTTMGYWNLAGVVECVTTDGSTPTATTPGTCSHGTQYSNQATLPTVDGTVTINMIATEVGQTNSAVETVTLTLPGFLPTPSFPYVANATHPRQIALYGVDGGTVIYTTNGSTPTVSAGTCTATNGTSVANGSGPSLTATTTINAISCLNGTTAALSGSPATYTIDASPTTWFVRADGGTLAQCNGKYDVAYSAGIAPNCAVNDWRYLWDNGSYGNWQWIIAGGDTVVIRGCHAASDQGNPSDPDCRQGYDTNSGSGTLNWCAGSQSNFGCTNPQVPPGDAAYPTQLLGGCAYGSYSCTPVNTYPLASDNLAQIFGGFGGPVILNLQNTQYVNVEGLEITAHNNSCSSVGVPHFPKGCSNSTPADDYGSQGIATNNYTTNILLQDVYIHGMSSSGIWGPIGANITATRVGIDFNAFSGWDFADTPDTPNGANASLTQSYVSMIGNGCNEQYPIVNASFPARSCYDTQSTGFGDSWSGQDASMTSFSCDHCTTLWNTKDGLIGPHVLIGTMSLTNSAWWGNGGSQLKIGIQDGGSLLYQNNLLIANCYAMSGTVPGAANSFAAITITGYTIASGVATFTTSANSVIKTGDSVGLFGFGGAGSPLDGTVGTVTSASSTQFTMAIAGHDGLATDVGQIGDHGAFVSNFCRAAGAPFAMSAGVGASMDFYGDTIVNPMPGTTLQMSCTEPNQCSTSTWNYTDDVFLAYSPPSGYGPFGGGYTPGLYWSDQPQTTMIVNSSHNDFFGNRNDDCHTQGYVTLTSTNAVCTDPSLNGEPSQATYTASPSETLWYGFNFHPTGAPLLAAGTAVSGLTTDYYGTARANPPTIGAVETTAPATLDGTLSGAAISGGTLY